MAVKQLINLGSSPDSGTGDSARLGGEKINTLFADVYANLGDNPVGNNPRGPYYGIRRPIREYEQIVGEIHPAGRFVPIEFTGDSDKDVISVNWDSDHGHGLDTGSVTQLQFDNAQTAPIIYRHKNWYFLSRGESVTLDLSNVPSMEDVHIVLPLGVAGDIIKVRDSLGTWTGKHVNVWTTPYEFQDSDQELAFCSAHGIEVLDSDVVRNSVSIRQPDGEYKVCCYRSMRANYEDMGVWDVDYSPRQTLEGSNTRLSPIRFTSATYADIEFTCLGPQSGWGYSQGSLLSVSTKLTAIQDMFNVNEWLLNQGASVEDSEGNIIIEDSYYIIPLYSGVNVTTLENAASTPIFKVFRRVSGGVLSGIQNKIPQIVNTADFDFVSTDPVKVRQRERWSHVYGRDYNESTNLMNTAGNLIAGVNGFLDTNPDNMYTEVSLKSIVDTSGNILLISRDPFDGFAQIYVPTS